MAVKLQDLNITLFTDGADKAQIREMAEAGFTTNPPLMRAAKVSDYASYARELVAAVPDRHISFEVFSDDIPEMIEQALLISGWGANVYVKLPVTTSRGEQLFQAIHALSHDRVKVNLTAVFTAEQVADGIDALSGGASACLSVFRRSSRRCWHRLSTDYARCGEARPCHRKRRGDLGIDAGGFQCDRSQRHAMSHHHRAGSGVKKLSSLGTKSGAELSLDAVRTFGKDDESAGLTLPVGRWAA
jgi:transaldolase